VDVVAIGVAPGTCSASHLRTCTNACGKLATVWMSAILVPGRTSTLNRIGNTASATATSGGPSVSASMVALTAPSTEFSTGTQAASKSPTRTPFRAAGTVSTGTSSSLPTRTRPSAACSVNVPCGPK